MKQYTISTGAKLRYDRGAYVARVDWCGKELFTVFTPDEGVSDVSADAAVALFEKIYARKEYYMMLVRDFVKAELVKEFSDEEYRDHVLGLEEDGAAAFDGLLAETEPELFALGNEGEISVDLYDYSKDVRYKLLGTAEDGFTQFIVKNNY